MVELYPVSLLLAGLDVLVVGGGAVALRKVRGLLRTGAQITLVAPEVEPELAGLVRDGRVQHRARTFHADDLQGPRLVFTATGRPDVDAAVVRAATAAGCFVNAADQGLGGTLDVPATVRRGRLTVAVSTNGAAPGLAAELAQEIAARLPEGIDLLLEALSGLREALREALPHDRAARRAAFAAAYHAPDARAAAAAGDAAATAAALRRASGVFDGDLAAPETGER
jgi:siroheme synthase-like protein